MPLSINNHNISISSLSLFSHENVHDTVMWMQVENLWIAFLTLTSQLLSKKQVSERGIGVAGFMR